MTCLLNNKTKVLFHNYQAKKSRIGALYYNSEITKLLFNLPSNRYKVMPHNFSQWLHMNDKALFCELKDMKERDILVSNIGPYAYLYCYLRDKFGLDFKIIRDIRTSFWIGYFLQETLCAPFTRNTDLVLFPSEFTRQLFIRFFPNSLNLDNTAVSYPLASFFPPRPSENGHRRNRHLINIGYIGRMSDAKNFDQVLEIFVKLRKSYGKRYKLHLLGQFDKYSKFRKFRDILNFLKEFAISDEDVVYNGFVSYKDIWKFYNSIDVLLFPSAASVESLGRVLIEATHWNIPVIANHYAAAPEIIPIHNLAPFQPTYDSDFSMIRPCSLGKIDVDFVTQKIGEQLGIPVPQIPPQYYKEYFYSLLESRGKDKEISLTASLRSFIQEVDILTEYTTITTNKRAASQLNVHLWEFMSMYVGISPSKRAKLFFQLIQRSRMKLETFSNFLFVCLNPDFFIFHSHVREICNYFGFDVTFRLNRRNTDMAPLKSMPFQRLYPKTP